MSGPSESNPVYAPVLVESAERAIEYIRHPDPKRECVLLVNIGGELQQYCGIHHEDDVDCLVHSNDVVRKNFSNVCYLGTDTNENWTFVYLCSYSWKSHPSFDYEVVLDMVGDARIDGNHLIITGTDGFDGIQVEFPLQDRPGPIAGISPKTKAKPAEKPVPKSAVKPKKKKAPAEAPKSAKNGLSYEVRVNGAIRATFSSKAKAEAEKKKLKAKGEPAKIVIVGY